MARSDWTVNDIPDQTGKTAIVTGANSGLGEWTAQGLAGKGAHVVMACRDVKKAEKVAADIKRAHPKASLEIMPLDLASLASVKEFADAFRAKHQRLDLLCNNAGVMFPPRGETKDGFEVHIGVNHFGHFALTGRLIDMINAAPAGRVVAVSSEFGRFGQIKLNDINSKKSFSRMGTYAQSKLANLMFALELSRRLAAKGARTIVAAAHPGYSATALQTTGLQTGAPDALAKFGLWSMEFGNSAIAQSAAMGALPTLYGATAPDVKSGDYYGPKGFMNLRGYPGKAPKPPQANNAKTAAKLFDLSEELTGVKFA